MTQGYNRGSKGKTNSPTCPFFAAHLIHPSSNREDQLRHDNNIPCKACKAVFIEIQSNLRRKKLHKTNQGSNLLGGSFSNRDYLRGSIQFRR